jgi:hypothetical protein
VSLRRSRACTPRGLFAISYDLRRIAQECSAFRCSVPKRTTVVSRMIVALNQASLFQTIERPADTYSVDAQTVPPSGRLFFVGEIAGQESGRLAGSEATALVPHQLGNGLAEDINQAIGGGTRQVRAHVGDGNDCGPASGFVKASWPSHAYPPLAAARCASIYISVRAPQQVEPPSLPIALGSLLWTARRDCLRARSTSIRRSSR